QPAVLGELRRWTSNEALGSVTVDPDCTLRIRPAEKEEAEHTLPSPEEQLQAVALKFPAEVVCVDVSGKNFLRMTNLRRSLMNIEYEEGGVRKRTGKSRRPRGKRRNTIAGTDAKELEAIVGDSSDANFGKSTPDGVMVHANGTEKKSHLENLKEWGKSRLRSIRKEVDSSVKMRTLTATRRKWDKEEVNPHSSSGNWSASSESGHSTATSHVPRSSISSGSMCLKHKRPAMVSTSSSVTSESTLTPDDGETCSMYSCDTEGYYTSFHLDSGLKTLREEEPCPPMHCTSALSVGSHANISSLTGDSEYELFGKGSTSTTASSNGTVCTTLLVPPAPTVPERVCSQLSGNKTLPERNTKSNTAEVTKRETQSLKLEKKSNMKMLTFDEIKNLSDENRSDERDDKINKSVNISRNNERCMITVDVHHASHGGSPEKCGDSPDSGHNTCSSPVDSVASPSIDLEMSECSDLEGVDRMERIRVKTTINSSRIPSMCVITPPQSDDEVSLNQYNRSVDSGEYVAVADYKHPGPLPQAPLSGRNSEFISLNELPPTDSLERRRRGARVTLDAEGKVVYSSDSLRRKKTTATFEPGPCVTSTNSPVPPRQINVRPVQIHSPFFALRREPSPSTLKVPDSSFKRPNGTSAKDLSGRGVVFPDRSLSPLPERCPSDGRQYFPKSTYDRLSPGRSCRPLSPLVIQANNSGGGGTNRRVTSPVGQRKPTSPKMVVRAKPAAPNNNVISAKGAYVKVAQPSEDPKFLVKRSDSYRLANDDRQPSTNGRKQYGVGHTLMTPVQTAANNKASHVSPKPEVTAQSPLGLRTRNNTGQSTWPRSTSTPTKNHDAPPLDFTTVPSPIQNNASTKTTRSAMDLFAIIHESKKRIQKLQKPSNTSPVSSNATSTWPKSNSGKTNEILSSNINSNMQINNAMQNIPQPMPPLNNMNRRKVQMLEESPKNLLLRKMYTRPNTGGDNKLNHERASLASDRHGPPQPTSRNDFKRLLLQTGSGTNNVRKESAVERLKNKSKNSNMRHTWKFDVLSTTIPEDCGDEDEQDECNNVNAANSLKSSALVNSQNKVFQARASPTLETAL
ncbi:hypothetical protein AAG570_006692, partial [Ranatra chinensis]